MRNFAILGAGWIADVMSKTLAGMREEVHAYAVASRSLEKAQKFAAEHGFEKAYGSYEQMLADPKVDLVYIAVPHSHHYQWTIASLNAGKHVLCEKAFAVNETQAKEMIDLARQKGLLLAEAIWTRYQPARRMIDDLIREGVIGRPEVVTANLDYYITHQERSVEPYLAGRPARIVDALATAARGLDVPPLDLALSWVLQRPAVGTAAWKAMSGPDVSPAPGSSPSGWTCR